MPYRPLTPAELELVRCMLTAAPDSAGIAESLSSCLVEEMDDGGMGSLRFRSGASELRIGREIATATFDGADGTLVSVALSVDQFGSLYELDIWKVDFSPLKRLPSAAGLRISN